ncbi:hypothetical protein NDU88_006433 [Pleurodeles waltl]|uniref:Uncharacterized protein n=1 Tax=Pleurodeles waltl TaxID=8319 RepID=A0AAV7MEZ1_PLEWA|nr:hypothetical protein NDU88_006433 [Pleurodeles waltl]
MQKSRKRLFDDDDTEEDELLNHVVETYLPSNMRQQNRSGSNESGVNNIIPAISLTSESAMGDLGHESSDAE